MAYRDGYARPNHLKSPQFFEEGYRESGVSGWIRQTKSPQFFEERYRESGVSGWIRQTKPCQFFEEVVEIVEHWDAGTTSMMV